MNLDWAVETNRLTKRYGGTMALDGLDLTIPRGSLCGLAGMNGAGKTTTLRLLLGMSRPDSGEARVCGLPIQPESSSVAIRKRATLLPEEKALFPYMKVGQIIRFTRGFYPHWRTDLERKLMGSFELPLEACVTKLSKGKLGQLHLLLSLCRGVELIFLDEPTDGLDPVATEQALAAMVSLVAEGDSTIVFCSHRLNEIEQVADWLSIVDRGRALLSASLDEVKSSTRRVTAVFDGTAETARSALAANRHRVQVEGRTLSWIDTRDWRESVAAAHALGAQSVQAEPVGLRELFLELVKS